jgi:aminomethyltransferase
MNAPLKTSPLHAAHLAGGARMTALAGWEMPADYGDAIAEHHAVRQAAGVFDVSHLVTLEVSGAGATPFLRELLANDVATLKRPGSTLYSCMLDDNGRILDDLIVYRISDAEFRLVANPGNAERDVRWMRKRIAQSGANVSLGTRHDLAMFAIQGPQAIERAMRAIPELNTSRGVPAPFSAVRLSDLFIARTGFTGEDGLEVSVPVYRAEAMWETLLRSGVRPCGLVARNTLRLEAGFRQYGQDMTDSNTPLDVGLVRTIDFSDPERDFAGREALEDRPWITCVMGLVFDAPDPEAQMPVITPRGDGATTSAVWSPTLGRSIAFAHLPQGMQAGETVHIALRGERIAARVVEPPFVRDGKPLV